MYQTSTYVQDGLGHQHKGLEYGRTQNPTRMALERNVAAIESGTAAFAFASGMAAIDAVLTRLSPAITSSSATIRTAEPFDCSSASAASSVSTSPTSTPRGSNRSSRR